MSITCWQNESKDTNALEYSVQAMNDTAGSGDLSKTSASDNTDGKNSPKTWNIITQSYFGGLNRKMFTIESKKNRKHHWNWDLKCKLT